MKMQILVKEFDKGVAYLDKGRYEKALSLFKQVLKYGEFKEAWLNLGVAYKGLRDYKAVKECFDKACDPKLPMSNLSYPSIYPLAEGNIGLWHYTFEQDDLAIQQYKKILAADPEHAETLWNLAIVQLRKYCSGKEQNLTEAWNNYNYRFHRIKADVYQNDKPDLLLWDCSTAYPDKNLVVMNEQGHGDMLMFARYLKHAEKYFKEIHVHCTPEMNSLFARRYKTVKRTSESDADYGVPMCSLARLLDYIPEGEWLKDLRIVKPKDGKLDILCVWSGSAQHINNSNRSVPAGFFDRFKNMATLWSTEKRKGYKNFPIKDWENSIKQLGQIDLVITVDTSIAHLCGSLGMPCIVLMPLLDTDFRWGDSSLGEKNLWYPSVRVVRNPNDWVKVFSKLENMVKEYL